MKKQIVICMGSSCFARGNNANLAFLEGYLCENRLQDEVELIGSCCEGKCAQGPNIRIGNNDYHGLDVVTLADILDREFGHGTSGGAR